MLPDHSIYIPGEEEYKYSDNSLAISRSYVSRIEKKAIQKLMEEMGKINSNK
ncbi:hypothetical protein DOT_1671 [Desulfosporosinus sp. OT]|nr:hypothetical protein DOT_1671 [Desulfosporosinus sp. OT]